MFLYTYNVSTKFWKVGSHKIFTVAEAELSGSTSMARKLKKKRSVTATLDKDTSSDSDFESPLPRKCLSKAAELYDKVKKMRGNLGAVLSLSPTSQLPPGLLRHLKKAIQCNICQEVPMQTPVMFARCCQQLLGCQTCVDQWYTCNIAFVVPTVLPRLRLLWDVHYEMFGQPTGRHSPTLHQGHCTQRQWRSWRGHLWSRVENTHRLISNSSCTVFIAFHLM